MTTRRLLLVRGPIQRADERRADERRAAQGQHGSALTTLLITMIPLLMLVTAATTVMTGRNNLLLRSIHETKALLAASAALEQAAQAAQEGTLTVGSIVAGSLGGGVDYEYEAINLATDGEDNDGDGMADEADERAYEVIGLGLYGRGRKRVAGVIVEPELPPGFNAAILTLGTPEIRTVGESIVSGIDTAINGGPGLGPDVHGIATEPPHTAPELLANYTRTGVSAVDDIGGIPSFGATGSPYNLPGIVSIARSNVENLVEPGTFTSSGLGNASTNDYQISYCPGDLLLASSNRGAGILLVTGDLTIRGSFRFDGLIVVLGNFDVAGDALVNGAVIQGPGAESIEMRGTGEVRFSSEALRNLNGLVTHSYMVQDWREIAL